MACPMRKLAVLSPVVRLALGGLMAFSGWMKLGLHTSLGLQSVLPLRTLDPQDFVFAINGFKLGLPAPVIVFLAFAVAWAEFFSGLALILGWMTRGAALLVALMMAGFMAGIASLMARGLDVNCPCFGAIKLFCTGPMGACHLVRNTGFMAAAMWLVLLGPGAFSLDRLIGPAREPKGGCAPKATPEPAA